MVFLLVIYNRIYIAFVKVFIYSYLMKIVFDQKLVKSLRERHTVLELDTVMQPGMIKPLTLHLVVEHVPISEMAELDHLKRLHEEMIVLYKKGEWELVANAVSALMGKFNGELDSFYLLVLDFSQKSAMLNKKWDGVKHLPAPEIS
jgi:hypothetical protein